MHLYVQEPKGRGPIGPRVLACRPPLLLLCARV
jgi:hypothetical protein